MRRLVPLALLALLLCSCAANWRAIMPGGVSAADAEWDGVKTAPAVSILASLDPRAAGIGVLLQAVGQDDPFGNLMPLTMPGETQPRWVLCQDDMARECQIIRINDTVHFAGSPINIELPAILSAILGQPPGRTLLWRPTRLKAERP